MAEPQPQPQSAPTQQPQAGDILFYSSDAWPDRLIQWWTASPYSHCAVAVSSDQMIEALGRGVSLSTIRPPAAVAAIGGTLNPGLRDKAVVWLYRQLGCHYSYLDILGDALGRVLSPRVPFLVAPHEYDCSQLATMFLVRAGDDTLPDSIADEPERVSPGDLARALDIH